MPTVLADRDVPGELRVHYLLQSRLDIDQGQFENHLISYRHDYHRSKSPSTVGVRSISNEKPEMGKRSDRELLPVRQTTGSAENGTLQSVLHIAASFLTALVIGNPAVAGQDWPDAIEKYVIQIRRTIETTDMDGYLLAVRKPNGHG